MVRFRSLALAACLALLAQGAFPGAASARSAYGGYLAARQAAIHHDFGAAAREMGAALAENPDNLDFMEDAALYRAISGDMRGAAELAEKLVARDKTGRLGHLLLATDELARGEPLKVIERLTKTAPDALPAMVSKLLLGWAQLDAGQHDAALRLFRGMEGGPVTRLYGLYNAALAAAMVGRDAEAEQAFSDALAESDTPNRRIAEAFGRFLESARGPAKAAAFYRHMLEQLPGDRALERAFMRATAGGALKEPLLMDARAGAAEALYGVSELMGADESAANALLHLRLAEHLDPSSWTIRLALGRAWEGVGRLPEAEEAYRSIPADDETYGQEAALSRADALNAMGRTNEAIAAIDSLIARDPKDWTLHSARGDMLRGAKRFEEAARAYDAALAMRAKPAPSDWALYFARGIANERHGAWEEAKRDFNKSLELKPDHAPTLNYLGYSLIEKGEDLEAARELIKKAVDLRPNEGYIVDSYGWVLYRLGDFEEAARYLEQAAELDPSDPVVNDHLGDALWMVGRRMEARFQWRRALSFKPEEKDRARILEKLELGLDKVILKERDAEKAHPAASEGGKAPEKKKNGG